MDTINEDVMQQAGFIVSLLAEEAEKGSVVHTVTVILNGNHGGADVIVQGLTLDFEEFEARSMVK